MDQQFGHDEIAVSTSGNPWDAGGLPPWMGWLAGHWLALQAGVVVAASLSVVWFLAVAWIPIVESSLKLLPDQAAIRQARLEWPEPTLVVLGQNRFLSVMVDLEGTGKLNPAIDLHWVFCREHLKLASWLGYLTVPYPRGWIIFLNRAELEPRWGAWRPAVLAGTGLATGAILWLCWMVQAGAYAVATRLGAVCTDRLLTWSDGWRISVLASVPGVLWASLAVVLYGSIQLNLIRFLVAVSLHWLIDWGLLVAAVRRLPPKTPKFPSPRNPFAASEDAT